MRLICTNCDAQYEVDDSVIPEGGRDVQCSNCGHAWFQPGRFDGPADGGNGAPEAASAPPEPAGGGYVEDDEAADIPEDTREVEPSGEGAGVPPAAMPPPSSQLDDDMLAILREEAERETRARRAEGTADLEMQADLGLPEAGAVRSDRRDAAGSAADVAEGPHGAGGDERVADLSAADDDLPRGHRRELLPDIETINSTLRATNARTDDDDGIETPEVKARERGGFRLGFSISLIVAVVLLALYVLAPSLAQQVPALSPALSAYVSAINEARMWIDEMMRSSTEAMRGS